MMATPDTFAAADLPPAVPATAAGWRDQRRGDRFAAAEIREQQRDAKERRRLARLDDTETRRAARLASRRTARDAKLTAISGWVSEHSIDLMFIPVVVVPGWLGWDAMSSFGRALYAGPGGTLPLLSETAMWIFDFAVIRARRKDATAVVWPLYAGMVVAALICAALNFFHGLTGPIPGRVPPGVAAGLVYALISISGIVFHQIAALGGRKRKAANKPANKRVVGHVVGRPAAPLAGSAVGRLVGRLVGQGDAGELAGQLDRAVADRDRLAKENAALRRQLANPKGGNPDSNDGDHDDSDDETEMPARRGGTQAKMRTYWDERIAAGKIPNGSALNVEAGKLANYSLGKKYADQWRKELSPEFIERASRDQQEASAREESTSTDQAAT